MNIEAMIALAALVVGMVGSVLMLAFQAGRLSARVDNLETWRDEMHQTLDAIYRLVRGNDRGGHDRRP